MLHECFLQRSWTSPFNYLIIILIFSPSNITMLDLNERIVLFIYFLSQALNQNEAYWLYCKKKSLSVN